MWSKRKSPHRDVLLIHDVYRLFEFFENENLSESLGTCWALFVTARKRSLQRLCFYTFLSVILFTGGNTCWIGTPPPGRYTPAGTPPGRYTPQQVHPPAGTPLIRYTPQAGTPRQVPLGRYTPWAGTPPGQVPPGQVHPLWAGTPPQRQILRHTVNERTVCILLECILV